MSRPGPTAAEGWESRLFEFLRAELAPTPGRAAATARVVIATVVTTAVVMALHAPHASYAIVTVFIVSQPNAGASLWKAILRILGTVLGAAVGIVVYTAFVDQPWLRVALLGPLMAFFLFVSQTTTAPYFGLLAGITAAMVLTATGSTAELGLEVGLWRFVMVLLGAVIGTAAQLFLWPGDPERHLLQALSERLKVVESLVEQRLRGPVEHPVEATGLLLTGLSQQLDLLDNAEARHPSLRHHHVEQAALIGGVEQLLTAAMVFSRQSGEVPPAMEERVRRFLGRCARVRCALEQCQPVNGFETAEIVRWSQGVPTELLPGLMDLEQTLAALVLATGFLDGGCPQAARLPSRLSLDAPTRGAFFTPAFTLANIPVIRFSLRVGLATTLAYLICEGLHWSGISTAVWTTIMIAQGTVGATVQKALLRLVGAVLGGGLGVVVILVLMPIMTGLASLLVVTAAATALAGWILAGSARIAYVGIQIGLAFALCVLNDLGPTTQLAPARDRVIGVLLGIGVSLVVFSLTGGMTRARGALRPSLASAIDGLSGLARVGLCTVTFAPAVRPVRGWRWRVYLDLSTTLRLCDESKFEFGDDPAATAVERARIARQVVETQTVFLSLLALVHHRLEVDLTPIPSGVHDALRRLAESVVEQLHRLADHVRGVGTPADPDLDRALGGVREHLTVVLPELDPDLRGHLEGRYALYEKLVGHLHQLQVAVDEPRLA